MSFTPWSKIETVSDLKSEYWRVIDSETAGKTGLIKISAGAVRKPDTPPGPPGRLGYAIPYTYEKIINAEINTKWDPGEW